VDDDGGDTTQRNFSSNDLKNDLFVLTDKTCCETYGSHGVCSQRTCLQKRRQKSIVFDFVVKIFSLQRVLPERPKIKVNVTKTNNAGHAQHTARPNQSFMFPYWCMYFTKVFDLLFSHASNI